MRHNELSAIIEAEWSPDRGFFWRLRQGEFDQDAFNGVLGMLLEISIDEDTISRRLVSLLWYIPLFMYWQLERVEESGGDQVAYKRAITIATNEIERILGTP